MNIVISYLLEEKEEIEQILFEDILRMYGNIDIEKAKRISRYRVEEYYPIERLLFMN